jgi:hypothetical protein
MSSDELPIRYVRSKTHNEARGFKSTASTWFSKLYMLSDRTYSKNQLTMLSVVVIMGFCKHTERDEHQDWTATLKLL